MQREIGPMLTEIREAAGVTQRQLAERIGANQTRISRIEAGEGDDADVASFLKGVDSPDARALTKRLQMEWRQLPAPSLRHPDLDVLVAIENGLARIRRFLADGQTPALLVGQADLLERRLEHAGRYLFALNHEVAYVGEIGVGKTTAACRQAGLTIDDATIANLKGMMLDTGGGRTTLCDVYVLTGDRFAIHVEPIPDEEIYKLVSEICRSVYAKVSGANSGSSAEFKPGEEVERALRNMARLLRAPRSRNSGTVELDPAVDLARKCSTLEDFTAEFAARLTLWRRSRRVIEFDGTDQKAGRQWLRSTFTAINNGRHDDFSLPARITATVPFVLVSDSRLAISIIDTRGVDGSAVRPDILSHLKNDRAVTLLCSKWGSAPDPSIQTLLTHATETDADPVLLSRVAILALARAGDALSMRHDSGENAEEISEGYEIKLGHIDDALQKIGIRGVEAFAFDSASDDPADLTKFILAKVQSVRKAQVNAAFATVTAVEEFLANQQQAHAVAVAHAVSGNISRFADRHRALRGARRSAHDRLIGAVLTLHPRTVWATTRRGGRFWNFDVFQYLGDGAAAEAKVRSYDVFSGLTSVIESDRDNPDFASARGFLDQVLANVPQWEADFVDAARHHAIAVYQEPLGRAQDLWDRCEASYGTGSGVYRDQVAAILRHWFEENVDLREELERRTTRAWETSVISPLCHAAGITAGTAIDGEVVLGAVSPRDLMCRQ